MLYNMFFAKWLLSSLLLLFNVLKELQVSKLKIKFVT